VKKVRSKKIEERGEWKMGHPTTLRLRGKEKWKTENRV